jgi:hypothetical protein
MGINLLGSSAGKTDPPNPNPELFSIINIKEIKSLSCICVVQARYLGCTPYDGRKILVYRSTKERIKDRIKLDPHFLEKDFSPIARFPFTTEGLHDAEVYANLKSFES